MGICRIEKYVLRFLGAVGERWTISLSFGMAAPHLISSSNLLPSLIAAHQAHSEYKFLPSSILYQEETMITMTSSRCDGEGLVVIPLSHWRCFQCDLCGETFEPEDDPKNQRRAQPPTSKSVSGCHRAVAPTTTLECYFTCLLSTAPSVLSWKVQRATVK